jgi:hypothetical protein
LKCHRTESTEDESFVRYRPLGQQCKDCHKLGTTLKELTVWEE